MTTISKGELCVLFLIIIIIYCIYKSPSISLVIGGAINKLVEFKDTILVDGMNILSNWQIKQHRKMGYYPNKFNKDLADFLDESYPIIRKKYPTNKIIYVFKTNRSYKKLGFVPYTIINNFLKKHTKKNKHVYIYFANDTKLYDKKQWNTDHWIRENDDYLLLSLYQDNSIIISNDNYTDRHELYKCNPFDLYINGKLIKKINPQPISSIPLRYDKSIIWDL